GWVSLRNASGVMLPATSGAPPDFFVIVTWNVMSTFCETGDETHFRWYLQSSSSPSALFIVSPYPSPSSPPASSSLAPPSAAPPSPAPLSSVAGALASTLQLASLVACDLVPQCVSAGPLTAALAVKLAASATVVESAPASLGLPLSSDEHAATSAAA